ncbi:MAG TPA: class I SAM-dependent methyltransferase [Flavilitoribacter sp.]|nr:class I SAM-dependent methyltransferase [Flavilitoribacter sp.]
MMNPVSDHRQGPIRDHLYTYADGKEFEGKTPEEVFTQIYQGNLWENNQSVSGHGSTPEQTAEILRLLPGMLRRLGVKTLIDVPCGDFNWMQKLDLSGMTYTGADIVGELIESNRQKYGRDGLQFERLNLLEDPMDAYDLVFCRDCLVHFSIGDIHRALDNIRTSGSRYLMTTTFTGQTENRDIPTGGWRPINFQFPPFNFPEPVLLLNEKCTEWDGLFGDKSLGVWRMDAALRLRSV